jgi:hypothetical protein
MLLAASAPVWQHYVALGLVSATICSLVVAFYAWIIFDAGEVEGGLRRTVAAVTAVALVAAVITALIYWGDVSSWSSPR